MEEPAQLHKAENAKILVVDDEPRIRDACKMVLGEEGFEVALAEDGDQGVAMIQNEHFDIILVDLMMPGLSGIEVLSYVRDKHPHTVVIVITGYATLEHSIEAMKKGAFDFIPKPFTPEQLRTVVGKALTYNRALQDIADSNSRLKTLVNSLTDGVMALDRDGRVVLANPAFLHMIDYHGASVIGSTIEALPVGETLQNMVRQTMTSDRDNLSEIAEELSWPEEESKRIFRVKCTPFRGRTGINIGTIVVLNDITALKELDQMKSDFVSLVCHEVRSPMNSLLMQIQVILDGLAGELTEKQTQILNRVSGKMLGLTEMVSELLDLSRIESGLITGEKESLDFNSLLLDQIELHTPGAAEKSISIQAAIEADLPAVMASRRGMEEVITNLVTNAIKYSPEKSTINVVAAKENEYLRVSVEDNGYGIPEEDLERIFDRFYRVKDENTRTQQGTGLGLSLIKSIIESHHGRVGVTSTLGAGAAFTFLIPLAGEG
jgi:two-component system phosphate regulon sensor histidine kinase PhoR